MKFARACTAKITTVAIFTLISSAHAQSPTRYDGMSASQWHYTLEQAHQLGHQVEAAEWEWLVEKFQSPPKQLHSSAELVLGTILKLSNIETIGYIARSSSRTNEDLPLRTFFRHIDVATHASLLERVLVSLPPVRQLLMLITIGNLKQSEAHSADFFARPTVRARVQELIFNPLSRLSYLERQELKRVDREELLTSLDTVLALDMGVNFAWAKELRGRHGISVAQSALANIFASGDNNTKTALADLLLTKYKVHDLTFRNTIENQAERVIKIEELFPDRWFALALHDLTGMAPAYLAHKSEYAKFVFYEFVPHFDGDVRADEDTLRRLGLGPAQTRETIAECEVILSRVSKNKKNPE